MNKSTALFLGLCIASAPLTHTFDKTDAIITGLASFAPFYYYMWTKNPVVKPPKTYTLNPNRNKFWSTKNAWDFFDQLLIGQRYKQPSNPIDSSLSKSPECLPTGFVGNFHEYVINIGGSTAKSLLVLYCLMNAKTFIKRLEAFK